jgi:hypothetical protein
MGGGFGKSGMHPGDQFVIFGDTLQKGGKPALLVQVC